jgi:hypothetical protein
MLVGDGDDPLYVTHPLLPPLYGAACACAFASLIACEVTYVFMYLLLSWCCAVVQKELLPLRYARISLRVRPVHNTPVEAGPTGRQQRHIRPGGYMSTYAVRYAIWMGCMLLLSCNHLACFMIRMLSPPPLPSCPLWYIHSIDIYIQSVEGLINA